MSTTTRRRRALSRWAALLRRRFPTLSGPQVLGLALWSIGIVLARAASLHAVALALVCWLPFHALSLRKRLQEWYLEAAAKKGSGTGHAGWHRRDWEPRTTSAHLLRWILEDWPNHQLVLALDPTNFGDRFTVLAISVLYRSCAVPVMWTVLPGNEPGAWEPHWERMLQELATLVPPGWQVLVLTDRGMYSPRLFHCLVGLGWHPFLRIRAQGFWRPVGSREWLDLSRLPLPKDQTRAWSGEVFKNDEGRLQCTLVGYAGEGHAEPWLIVTDLAPEVAQASWYGLRGWVEQGYKRVKGEGWRWPRTRIASCERLERLWLAVAVATLWVLEVGARPSSRRRASDERSSGPRPWAKTRRPCQIWSPARVKSPGGPVAALSHRHHEFGVCLGAVGTWCETPWRWASCWWGVGIPRPGPTIPARDCRPRQPPTRQRARPAKTSRNIGRSA